jgi:hypothetical protein
LSEYEREQLKLLGCEIRLIPSEYCEISIYGRESLYPISAPKLEIQTTCEKQEIVLKLLFGDELLWTKTITFEIFYETL